jgi:GT2 family glycosyltransferase/glycosyltransferase involved in cell wall biosynthesis
MTRSTSSVSIIIVNYNGAAFVATAIQSALGQIFDGKLEVIVVDNASTDDSLDVLSRLKDVTVLALERNIGYGGGVNAGAGLSNSEFIAMLNPDAEASPQWLQAMVNYMNDNQVDFASSVVSAGPRNYFAGGDFIPWLGVTLPRSRYKSSKTDWISGCALVARRNAFEALEGFDERFFLYYEDVDLTLRARRSGYQIRMMPVSLVDHPADGRSTNVLGTRKSLISYESRGRLIAKHLSGLARFPAALFALALARRNGVAMSDLPAVASAIIRGINSVNRQATDTGVRKPRIGILANTYEASTGIRAGGHVHFIEVAKRWQGVDTIVFAPNEARADIARELPLAEFVSMPALKAGSPKATDFLYRAIASPLRLRQLRQCDALYTSSHFLPDVAPAVISGRPFAVIIHHLIAESDGTRSLRKSIVPLLAERSALFLVKRFGKRIIAGSRLVARDLTARGFQQPVTVTTNGVDHMIEVDRAEQSREPVRSGAVLVARIHPSKSIEDAIRAWKIVSTVYPSETLEIIGARESPEYAAALEKLVANLGLGSVIRFSGPVSEQKKAESFRSAKLFLFPSKEEGWGIAIAEAMRAGLPCVTYDLPIFDEIFPVGRLWAHAHDFEAMGRKVIDLIADDALRTRLSLQASTLAKTFTWDRAAEAELEAMAALFDGASRRMAVSSKR